MEVNSFSDLMTYFVFSTWVIHTAYYSYLLGAIPYKAFAQKGEVRVEYIPPKTNYLHQYIRKQPELFVPISLNDAYAIAVREIKKLDIKPERGQFYEIVLIRREEDADKPHQVVQKLQEINSQYATAKNLADQYGKLYNIDVTRLF